jgi:hypothetical protein
MKKCTSSASLQKYRITHNNLTVVIKRENTWSEPSACGNRPARKRRGGMVYARPAKTTRLPTHIPARYVSLLTVKPGYLPAAYPREPENLCRYVIGVSTVFSEMAVHAEIAVHVLLFSFQVMYGRAIF